MSESANADSGVPPRFLASGAARARGLHPGWILLGCIATAGLARLVLHFGSLVPKCGLLILTGIPCPMCGTTRSVAALSQMDLEAAFRMNPLAATVFMAGTVYMLVATVCRWRGCRWSGLATRLGRRPWPAIAVVAILLNWAYLVLNR
jgi:hypothetical protein